MPMRRTFADGAADLDHVPDLDRAFEKQDQAGHKIVNDVLQAKSDPDTECASQDSDFG